MNSFAVVDRSDFPSARFAFDFALFVFVCVLLLLIVYVHILRLPQLNSFLISFEIFNMAFV